MPLTPSDSAYPGSSGSTSMFLHQSASYSNGQPGSISITASAHGPITGNVSWNGGSANAPVPDAAIVQETSTATWGYTVGDSPDLTFGDGNPTAGLGSSANLAYSSPGWGYTFPDGSGYLNTKSCTGTRYSEVMGASSFTTTCSPDFVLSGMTGPYWDSYEYCTCQYTYKVALIIPAALQAHSTVDTANWDTAHPRFFSGTNCSVSGTATAYSAPLGGSSYVKKAALTIGGTLVKEYDDTSSLPSNPAPNVIYLSGTNQSSVPLSVFFDSTHFADSSSIPIVMTVTDSGGFSYTLNLSGYVYNKGYDGGGSGNGNNNQTNDGAQAASFVQGQYLSANVTPTLGSSDSRTATLNIIPTLCDFFTYAHGIDDTSGSERVWFGATDNKVDNFGNDYKIFGSQQSDPNGKIGVKEAVANKSVYQPPYNFVFLDTCNSAFQADLASGFGITTLTATDDDRAAFGWLTLVEDSLQNADWADYVYQQLQNGRTIQQAVDDANGYYQTTPLHQSTDPLSGLAHYQIYGDSGMTLHGTVHSGQQHHWFM